MRIFLFNCAFSCLIAHFLVYTESTAAAADENSNHHQHYEDQHPCAEVHHFAPRVKPVIFTFYFCLFLNSLKIHFNFILLFLQLSDYIEENVKTIKKINVIFNT